MSPTIPTPNDLTRQQLDELDALLQRMLSLPLNAPPVAPAPAIHAAPSVSLPAGWRSDPVPGPAPRSPYLAASPVTAEESEELYEQVAAMSVPLTAGARAGSAGLSTAPPWVQSLAAETAARPFAPPTPDTGVPPSAGPLRGVDAPALPPGFRPPVDSVPMPPAPDAFADLAPVPLSEVPPAGEVLAPAGVPVPLWPLFAANWVLELGLGLTGPVGATAAHPAAKHLLGAAGLLLLAGAGAWSARGMGWVAW